MTIVECSDDLTRHLGFQRYLDDDEFVMFSKARVWFLENIHWPYLCDYNHETGMLQIMFESDVDAIFFKLTWWQ